MPFISKEELDAMADKIAKELGLGSEEFRRGHEELMQMINEAEKRQRETRAQPRQMMDCEDVMAALSVSESAAYKIIRRLNEELKAANYITVRGKVSRAYFEKRIYGVSANE